MSSKMPALIALVSCLSLTCVRAQTATSRLGPVEDVPAANSTETKPTAATAEPKNAAKKDDAPKKSEPKKSETAKDAPKNAPVSAPKNEPKNDPAAPLTTAAAANTNEKSTADSTTDAPPKPSDSPAPVGHEARPVGFIPPAPKFETPQPLNAGGAGGSANNASASAGPTAPAVVAPTSLYRVGVGDVLDIRLVNGTAHDSTLFTILTGGLLDYPLAGDPFAVAGLTTDEVAVRLSAELKRRGIYDRAQFQVAVRDYASHTVLVSGLVDQPGQKILRREAVPLYVVLAEALPRADAGRAIIISRATGASKTVDLADANALNELVSAGDVINLQARPPEFFYIGGLIAAPGQKDFHAGLTLTQAILASGGLPATAGNKAKIKVTVSRQGADGRLIATDYALQEIEAGQTPDPRVQPGDRIEVGRKH